MTFFIVILLIFIMASYLQTNEETSLAEGRQYQLLSCTKYVLTSMSIFDLQVLPLKLFMKSGVDGREDQ